MQLAIDWLTSYLGASPMQIEPYIILWKVHSVHS